MTGEGQIFLAGGNIRRMNHRGPLATEGVSSNLFMYDQQFGSWQVKAKMNQARAQFVLAVVDRLVLNIFSLVLGDASTT